jgi:glycosyltransferase involved in cell wall biosynthesis
MKIYYVVDQKGWVQHRRFEILKKRQNEFQLKLLTTEKFKWLWRLGFLRRRPVFFSTWRTVHGLMRANPEIFKPDDFKYFLGAVTSHVNIGGGLNPAITVPNRKIDEAFEEAVGLLERFKVVSVNSQTLQALLAPRLKNLTLAENGVDVDFYQPKPRLARRVYNPEQIRIGWVGRPRGAKNFEVLSQAMQLLESHGGFKFNIIRVEKSEEDAPFSAEEMRNYYGDIDFYLCTSWNEGTPNPGLEAAACGVPVVTTRVGNMNQLIKHGENGYFIEPTVDSVFNQFIEISKLSIAQYNQMSNLMRNSIETNWSWEKKAEGFFRLANESGVKTLGKPFKSAFNCFYYFDRRGKSRGLCNCA